MVAKTKPRRPPQTRPAAALALDLDQAGGIGPATFSPGDRVKVGPVAKLFGVATVTVNDWVDRGVLPATLLPGGKHKRFLWRDVIGLWTLGQTAHGSDGAAVGQYETKQERKARGEAARARFNARRKSH